MHPCIILYLCPIYIKSVAAVKAASNEWPAVLPEEACIIRWLLQATRQCLKLLKRIVILAHIFKEQETYMMEVNQVAAYSADKLDIHWTKQLQFLQPTFIGSHLWIQSILLFQLSIFIRRLFPQVVKLGRYVISVIFQIVIIFPHMSLQYKLVPAHSDNRDMAYLGWFMDQDQPRIRDQPWLGNHWSLLFSWNLSPSNFQREILGRLASSHNSTSLLF